MEKILITSALPYANGYIHLGHLAGAYLPADLYARHKRLLGDRVLYVCGSDEHGVAITIAAEKEKVRPKDIIDKYHDDNKNAFEKFGMSFDIYSRTSTDLHKETAREFFADFLKKDLLVEKAENQFYDEQAKMFLPDRYVEGECPNCGSEGARGDQCDSCGAYYDQLELKNPVSLVSGKTPVPRKTTHWYMRFDKLQAFLEEFIESKSETWKDNVLQQTRSWLKQGLAERAITRDLNWGVRIDGIEGVDDEKAAGKVLYVWFDAVLGYISATKELQDKLATRGESLDWKEWWKSPDTRYIAFIGKDNIVFHTLIFPAMLESRDDGYILPENVPANEFLNLEKQKFSKSRNWSIDLRDFVGDFPEPAAIDALRYTLATNLPETKDADFSLKDYQARNNNELADILGNFVNRALTFLNKKFDGKVPELKGAYESFEDSWISKIGAEVPLADLDIEIPQSAGELEENDEVLIQSIVKSYEKTVANYERFRFRDAMTATMNAARAANKYFNDEEPWKTAKSDPDKCAKTLWVCSQLIRTLAVFFAPIVPNTSKIVFELLGYEPTVGEPAAGQAFGNNLWKEALLPKIKSRTALAKPEILFKRIEDDVLEAQLAKLGKKEESEEDLIDIEDFKKIELRTAKILKAEKIKKSKKLLKIIVDDGDGERQVIAGISRHYEPEDLIGKNVIIVANLKPAKLMGRESRGMILAANSADGKLSIAEIFSEEIPPGSEVR